MNKNYMRAIPKEWMGLSKFFTALGDEHRQRILLTFEKGERLNISQMVEVSTLSRTAVSHHLRVLREAKILQSEKVGKQVFFWINKPYMRKAVKALAGHIRATA